MKRDVKTVKITVSTLNSCAFLNILFCLSHRFTLMAYFEYRSVRRGKISRQLIGSSKSTDLCQESWVVKLENDIKALDNLDIFGCISEAQKLELH